MYVWPRLQQCFYVGKAILRLLHIHFCCVCSGMKIFRWVGGIFMDWIWAGGYSLLFWMWLSLLTDILNDRSTDWWLWKKLYNIWCNFTKWKFKMQKMTSYYSTACKRRTHTTLPRNNAHLYSTIHPQFAFDSMINSCSSTTNYLENAQPWESVSGIRECSSHCDWMQSRTFVQ